MAEEKRFNLAEFFGKVTDFLIPILQKTTTQAVAQIPAVKEASADVAVQRGKDVLWDILPIAGIGLLAIILIKKI